MVAYRKSTRLEGAPANDPAPTPGEIASYVYLTARELEAIARGAGLAELADALAAARERSAEALVRLGRG